VHDITTTLKYVLYMVGYGQINIDSRVQINEIGLTKCEPEIN
jgi:hypothetical protein